MGDPPSRWVFWLMCLVVIGVTIGLALVEIWPFNTGAQRLDQNPSLWQLLMRDRIVLGAIRLALTMLALYIACAAGALLLMNRWPIKLGAGIDTKAATEGSEALRTLREESEVVKRERDELLEILEMETRP